MWSVIKMLPDKIVMAGIIVLISMSDNNCCVLFVSKVGIHR